MRRLKRRFGVTFHRFVRAIRELLKAFRTGRPGLHSPAPGRDRRLSTRGGQGDRRSPWPYCPTCRRRVAELCPSGCGACPNCCPGHDQDDEEPDDRP